MPRRASRAERVADWIQHQNSMFAPLVVPVSGVGFVVAFALNRPAFGTTLGAIFIASLAAGKK